MIDPRTYRLRQRKITDTLSQSGLEAGVLVDLEGLRNRSLRYMCGQPADALLFLFAGGGSLLVPWDVALARSLAAVDETLPYERYGRSLSGCVKTVLLERGIKRAELSAALPYPLVRALKEALPEVELRCRGGGIDDSLSAMRVIKDPEETALLRRACAVTDELIELVSELLARPQATEIELALFLEAEARRREAEGMGFDTLAASAGRSYSIHCFPSITSASFGTRGLSILDFGVCFGGYTSDVTLTVVRPPLSAGQEAMLEAVREAYDLARSLCVPGADLAGVGEKVQELFERRGFHMPHSLGHGIGLDAHEEPLFRRPDPAGVGEGRRILRPGMVFTVEPGLYDPEEGGVRLENDLLCTERGTESLTGARFLHL
jgi:Xaa-Pro dipeptidase